MPGTFTYGLYPWQWLTEAGQSFHAPPTGAASVLDFRPLPAQGTQGQSAGWGLFAWPDGVAVPNDLVSLGSGYIATIQPSTAARNELRLKLGLAQNPAGATLVDCIADILGPLSVPDGSTGPKPLIPAADGTLEIQLAAHSRVWSLALDKANLLAANPNSRNNRIRDVIRAGIDTADAVGGVELAGKVLGSWLLTCGISREEIKLGAPGKKSQWERLLSPKLKAKHGANLKPKGPKTSFSESWPNDCADIEATAQDQTWDVVPPPFGSGGVKISSGRARGANSVSPGQAICNSSVSSADHYCQMSAWTAYSAFNGRVDVVARAVSVIDGELFISSVDGYYARMEGGTQVLRLLKVVSGAATAIGSDVSIPSNGATLRCRANGSTITRSYTGVDDDAVTDTAITGNLKGGIVFFWVADESDAEGDSWLIDDELNPPVAAFSGTPLSGTAPLSVTFADASTNSPTLYVWEKSSDGGSNWTTFASGVSATGPTEIFTTGTWAVRLTATNAGGSDDETKLAYVTVTAAGGAGVSALMLVRGFV